MSNRAAIDVVPEHIKEHVLSRVHGVVYFGPRDDCGKTVIHPALKFTFVGIPKISKFRAVYAGKMFIGRV